MSQKTTHPLLYLKGLVERATTLDTLHRLCDRIRVEHDVKALCGDDKGLDLMAAVERRKAYFAKS